eukprot:CAMPEP_0179152272 /NCGR_PEP_ID=MMETSP0796-20121207/73987_1 /TAXON_ID=73915 /ORGANISM="Pyrodinium bahamense, Strain pbaha01" /LENGTH=56 /DNA_ID=CAMNT_0020853463 /DNA_START=421 /DNA_END=588 /DNA_ORIENTATION=+
MSLKTLYWLSHVYRAEGSQKSLASSPILLPHSELKLQPELLHGRRSELMYRFLDSA